MASLVHSLLFDTKQRCLFLLGQLERLKASVSNEAADYRSTMEELVRKALAAIEATLVDPGVREPQLARNFYYKYKRLAELLQGMEMGPVVALSRYNEQDKLATRIVHRICKEIGYPYRAPLCSSISSQHYLLSDWV